MMQTEEKNNNIKEELEEKENSKTINNNNNSKNSQEKSKSSKSKETLEKNEEYKNNNQINLFKNSTSSKNSSSRKINQRYNTIENENEEEKSKKDYQDAEYKPKFMQINPHFNIFNKQIDSLRESIYDDTKRCLILKGSLQESSNYLKEESNKLIKDIVEQIYNIRELFEKLV